MSSQGLTPEEIEAEVATALPDKEVVTILDLNVDVDVFIDAAAPIDLAAAAQLNVAAPLEASAAANVLSQDSGAQAETIQTASVNQVLLADAYAQADQSSDIGQADEADGDPAPPPPDDGGTVEVGDLATLEGPLLNVDVNVDLDTDLAAPIAGAVAANANVAAPIDAAVAANVGSTNSDAIAFSNQDAVINQRLEGVASANAVQDSTIDQGTTQPDTTADDSTSGESNSTTSAGTSGDSSGGTDGGGTSGGDSSGGSTTSNG
ncbi:peptidoglycan-binding protein [Mycobacterium sp. NPDC050041]|uniref:peptidoglycan-binding protein n=1 Tax=Mycobacterium sp. NPDC050041 TaxID=3364293 RepID=UPI003C2CEC0D